MASPFGRSLSVPIVKPLQKPLSGGQAKGAGGPPVDPTLNALTVSPSSATVGTPYNGTVSGKTSGSTLSLTGAGAAGLSVVGATISGTPTTSGAVNIVETLAGATNTPRTSNGVITVAAAVTPLRVASTENRVSGGNETRTTRLRQVFRWPVWIAQDMKDLVVSFKNWSIGTAGTFDTGNAIGFTDVAFEYGSSVIPILVGGQGTFSLADGASDVQADTLLPAAFGMSDKIAKGTLLWVSGIVVLTDPTFKIPYTARNTSSYTGEQSFWFDPAATTVTRNPGSGFSTSGGTLDPRSNAYCPIILGHPVADEKSLFVFGDSISEGVGDSLSGASAAGAGYGYGHVQRASNDNAATSSLIPILNFAKTGAATSAYTQAAPKDKWKDYAKYANIGYSNLGTNNLSVTGTGSSAATLRDNMRSVWTAVKAASAGIKLIQSNVIPRATTADQSTINTGFQNGQNRDQYNDLLPAEVTAGNINAVIGMHTIEDAADHTKFRTDLGTPTTDGTHPTGPIAALMAVELRAAIAAV